MTTDHRGRAVADDQLHRLGDAARLEGLGTPAGDQERLVDVVMRDGAELVQVHAVEVDGDGFHEQVADRVRMAQPLALDNLLAAPRYGRVRERFDHQHGFIPACLHALGLEQAECQRASQSLAPGHRGIAIAMWLAVSSTAGSRSGTSSCAS